MSTLFMTIAWLSFATCIGLLFRMTFETGAKPNKLNNRAGRGSA